VNTNADLGRGSGDHHLLPAGRLHRVGEVLVVHRVDDPQALDPVGERLRRDLFELQHLGSWM
jgi:hypothetical protein